MKGFWEHLAYRVAKTDKEHFRAREQAACWDLVVHHLNRTLREGTGLSTRSDIQALAEALVVSKSEIAYKVDHG